MSSAQGDGDPGEVGRWSDGVTILMARRMCDELGGLPWDAAGLEKRAYWVYAAILALNTVLRVQDGTISNDQVDDGRREWAQHRDAMLASRQGE